MLAVITCERYDDSFKRTQDGYVKHLITQPITNTSASVKAEDVCIIKRAGV